MAERFLLVLWLTERCNLHCSYCYAGAERAGQDMAFATAKAAIDHLAGHPLKIQFAGGEPLLNLPLAEEICRYVREERIDATFQLQTNGTLLSREKARTLARLGISVGVSLDGVPAVNDRTRGETLRVVEGIRQLGLAGIVTGINAVVTADNVEALPQLVDFALYLGNVGGIGLDLLRHAGRGSAGPEDASPEQLQRALRGMWTRSRELERLSGRRIQLRELELARRRLRGEGQGDYCYAQCGRSVVVTPEGRLWPCGSLRGAQYAMGRAEELVPERVLAIQAPEDGQCGVCRYKAVCPKGCPARRIRNDNALDCVLLHTAFQLAEEEEHETDHEHHGYRGGPGPL